MTQDDSPISDDTPDDDTPALPDAPEPAPVNPAKSPDAPQEQDAPDDNSDAIQQIVEEMKKQRETIQKLEQGRTEDAQALKRIHDELAGARDGVKTIDQEYINQKRINGQLLDKIAANKPPPQNLFEMRPFIFPAKLTPGSGSKTFDEWTIKSGSFVKFTDGRHTTSDSDSTALVTPTGIVCIMAVPDVGGTYRHFQFGAKGADGTANLFTARIATISGTSPQWIYTFVEIIKSTSGYGGWIDKPGGRTGTCYNMNEDSNGGTPYGNGTDPANYTGSFDLQPFPVGTKILIFTEPDLGEYWFEDPNGVDGACTGSTPAFGF